MTDDPAALAALIGSRICHDLISPIGAIGNGVELLAMTGAVGPEMTLIAESVAAANARIRFFRIAFGAAAADQRIGATEIRSILDDMSRGGRLTFDWQVPGDQPRGLVKLAFLLLQCCESAMPHGGDIVIGYDGSRWKISASASKFMINNDLWGELQAPEGAGEPAHVQFTLAPAEARALSRQIDVAIVPNRIDIAF